MEFMLMNALREMALSRMVSGDSSQEFMEWRQYLVKVHNSVNEFEITPREWTEKGFFEWIVERSDIQKQLDYWLGLCKEENIQLRKDNNKATELRDKGNNFFQRKDYSSSVKSYTESARYAASDDDSFSIAIANRSAAFFHMNKYEKCLQDIQLAIDTGYPKNLLWKLHLRAAQSHLKLRQGKLAEDSLAELQRVVQDSSAMAEAMKGNILKQAADLSVAVSKSEKKLKTFSPRPTKEEEPKDLLPENQMFPFASTAVACKISPTKGRCVVANRPIKRGDIIFAEKPFAWVLLPQGRSIPLCAQCCVPMDDSLVPCGRCVDALYCSNACWNEARTYHQWECTGYQLGLWPQLGVSFLAFKTLIMSMTTTDTARFNNVQALITNIDKSSTSQILALAINALMLTTYIEKYTNIFDTVDLKECLVDKFSDPSMSFDIDISTKKGKKQYIGSMLLRHSLQMSYCSFGLQQLADPSIQNTVGLRIASGAYPSASLLNHSCDPMVVHSSWNNWLIVKAVKDIREGEEIFHCYGHTYKQMPKIERQLFLRKRYCFDCRCSACRNPRIDNYLDRFAGLKCPKCSGPMLPYDDSKRCCDCGAIRRITEMSAVQLAIGYRSQGVALFRLGKVKEAIPFHEKCLVISEKHMYRHNDDLVLAVDELAAMYACTGDWLKCLSCMDRSIAAVEEKCGDSSLDLAVKLNQMTEVLFECLERIPRQSKAFRDILIKMQKYVDCTLEIIGLQLGSWSDTYRELNRKRERYSGMLLEQSSMKDGAESSALGPRNKSEREKGKKKKKL